MTGKLCPVCERWDVGDHLVPQASGVQSTSVATGDEYVVSEADREFFRVNGYVHLKGAAYPTERWTQPEYGYVV